MVNMVGLSDTQGLLLAALRAADGPISATELRRRVNADGQRALVTEQVYRRLLALERRGLIQLAATDPGRRDTSWEPSSAARRKGL